MNAESQVITGIEMVAWMKIEKPDMTMDEAIEELESAGNKILEVDHKNRKIKVADYKVEQ